MPQLPTKTQQSNIEKTDDMDKLGLNCLARFPHDFFKLETATERED
jgi:hypothetical protein